MEIKLIDQPSPTKKIRRVVEEKVFKYYYEVKGYSRKVFKDKLGVGPAIFNRSVELYYTPLDIEKLRVKKIRSTTALHRPIKWRDRAKILEEYFPDLIGKVDRGEYVEALDLLITANDKVYDLKEALRLVLKHVRHGGKRRGLNINLVANALEYKVKKILDEMGLDYICQYYIDNRPYDFKLVNYPLLIEVDGRYHSESADKIKTKLAKSKGFKVLRLLEKEIKNVHYIKDKINKKLRKIQSM